MSRSQVPPLPLTVPATTSFPLDCCTEPGCEIGASQIKADAAGGAEARVWRAIGREAPQHHVLGVGISTGDDELAVTLLNHNCCPLVCLCANYNAVAVETGIQRSIRIEAHEQ